MNFSAFQEGMVGGHRQRTTRPTSGRRLPRAEQHVRVFAAFPIAPFDQEAADRFDSFQAAKVRIATRDLKNAAISMTSNALLLTANRRDFVKVPGLRFENWLN
jgi:tRNA(fMet)-specific endonuclease VapC